MGQNFDDYPGFRSKNNSCVNIGQCMSVQDFSRMTLTIKICLCNGWVKTHDNVIFEWFLRGHLESLVENYICKICRSRLDDMGNV